MKSSKSAIFSAAKKTAARDQKTYTQNPFQKGSRREEKIEYLSGLDPLISIATAQRYWQLATSKLLHHIWDPCRTKLQKLEQIRADSEKLWSSQVGLVSLTGNEQKNSWFCLNFLPQKQLLKILEKEKQLISRSILPLCEEKIQKFVDRQKQRPIESSLFSYKFLAFPLGRL